MHLSRISILVVMVTTSWTHVMSQDCPFGWYNTPLTDSCYYFTHNTATNTWEDARLKCMATGGDLVSVTSQQEWSYLNKTATMVFRQLRKSNPHYQHWWIGLNRRDDGSTWKWADGSTADMSLLTWVKGASLNDKTKNCVQLNINMMAVASCTSSSYQAICSRPKDLPIQCDGANKWEHYNGKCYKYFNTARTWADASKSCRTLGATLPIITDLTTQTIVADFARQQRTTLWSGLRSSGKPNNIQWIWQGGSPLAGNPYWAPNQPPSTINSHVNTTCVELNTNAHLPSTWVTNNCGTRRKYYCQRPEGKCADGWLEYGSTCYQFNPHYKLSWPKAKSYCQGLGGNLVTITSRYIQTFLNKYLHTQNQVGVPELWIGITDNNKHGGPWTFTNGVAVGKTGYSNWNSNTHTNHHGKQDCVYIVTSDPRGKWRVANSCTQVRSFICQIQTNTQVKKITNPPNSYICPNKWVNNGQYCYYFNENDNSYDSARYWCQRQMAELVRITDTSVQSFLESKVKRNGDYWIGLNDRHQEGWWAWLDDTINSTFFYWDKGEPNNWHGNENCAILYATGSPSRFGHWSDRSCSGVKYNFICQKKAQNAGNTPPPTTPKPWSTKCGPFWSSDPFTPFCYQFSDEKLTWYDARAMCWSRGGNLASIETSEESSYITAKRFHAKHKGDMNYSQLYLNFGFWDTKLY